MTDQVDDAPADGIERVLVAGATGKTGRHVLDVLEERGYEPVATTRSRERANYLRSTGVETVRADLLVEADVRRAVQGVDAAITCVGSTPLQVVRAHASGGSRTFVDGAGNRTLARMAEEAGLAAIVMCSSLGVGGDRASWMASLFGLAIGPVVAAKTEAERAIRQAATRHTILRPGVLLDQLSPLAVGDLHTAPAESGVWGVIARRTLARLLVASLSTPGAADQTLEVARNPLEVGDARPFDWDLGDGEPVGN